MTDERLVCPACRTFLLRGYQDPALNLEIEACPSCDGLWFDDHRLRAFLHSKSLRSRFVIDSASDPAEDTSYTIDRRVRRCPRDRAMLTTMVFGGVEVDVCPGCKGIWLDTGELHMIIERFQQGRGRPGEILEELEAGLHDDPHARSSFQKAVKALSHWFHPQGEHDHHHAG